jgi:hypothetical protein
LPGRAPGDGASCGIRTMSKPATDGHQLHRAPVQGLLATFLDRQGYNESAAIIVGFASFAPTAAQMVWEFRTAIAHVRDVLGDRTYESVVRKGEAMTMAAVVAYAYDRIDEARRELGQPN